MVRLLILLMLCFSVQAQDLTLDDFARHHQFIDIKISPDGKYYAATSRTANGTVQLIVLERASMKPVSQKYFDGRSTIAGFDWASNERLVLSVAEETGSLESPYLTGELYSVNADGSHGIMLTGYRAKKPEYTVSQVIDWLPSEKDMVLISSFSYAVEEPFVRVYRLNIKSGRKNKIATIPIRAVKGSSVYVLADQAGEPRIAMGLNPKDISQTLMLYHDSNSDTWTELAAYGVNDGSFLPYALSADGSKVYGISNVLTDTNAISVLDIKSRKETVLMLSEAADLSPIFSIRNGRRDELIGASYEYERLAIEFLPEVTNTQFKAQLAGLIAAFPDEAVSINSATANTELMIVTTRSANSPKSFFLYDAKGKKVSFLMSATPWLQQKPIPETRIIAYPARDGRELTALLTLPNGSDGKNLPLVLLPHGGPHGIRESIANMDSDAKVLANNGYAVLQPNFRGSGGFGKSFLQAGFKKWGTLMIDDMTDGVKFLIAEGLADPNRIAVYGASYGGYASLMSAIREPDLYRCVINFVGVADLELMYEKGDIPGSEVGTNVLEQYLGRSDAVLKGQSPIHNLDKLKAPVFIIHGAEDQRVPLIQAEVLKKALDQRGHPYEWLVKEKEGHGFYKPENEKERWEKMLEFLNKHMAI